MGILNEKNNKVGNNIKLENYSQYLKFQLLEHFSKIIDDFINNNEYQRAINYVESYEKNCKFEIPLMTNKNINDSLYELIINEKSKFMNFFVHLKQELLSCKKFYFIVSFIKFSGIQLLINTFDELEKLGIEGEIITSVYLNITEEKALRKLLTYKNIKVKIYNNSNESFHTKSYFFEKNQFSTVIIGSSNLSQSALYSAEEWNIKLTNNSFFPIFSKVQEQFYRIWNSNNSVELSEDFINRYEEYKKNFNINNTFDYNFIKKNQNIFLPNTMQKLVLKNLRDTRLKGKRKALVIAATGTGKTYLAALDIKNIYMENKKMPNILFLAHREELLENGIEVFSNILNINKNEIGKIYGGKKEINKKIIFSSVQSLRNILTEFPKEYFDYIIIDEFHHSSANSYIKIINYFINYFLLGLTATPERMDGQNVIKLCDYNVVGDLGLKKALEEDLISPFHYFGVNDIINYDDIPYSNGQYNDKILTSKLNKNTRTNYILNNIKKFGFHGEKMCGVAFCQNIEHAEFMKNEFIKNGYKAETITAKTNLTERSKILKMFKNYDIEILCVVDILNEGVDIPNINLLLFLRPTMSSTIFIQQLGRGLRKYKDKDFVTVIDFIGNHKKDYLITKIFSEEIQEKDNIYSKKDKIINEIKNQFQNIPRESYIELDRICQERIINKIEKINFNSKNVLKEMYFDLKKEIGKDSREFLDIIDFKDNIPLFKEIVNKMESFYNAQLIFENSDFSQRVHIENSGKELLSYFERKLPLCEPITYLILKYFMDSDNLIINERNFIKLYKNYFNILENFQHNYLIKRIFKELHNDKIIIEKTDGYELNGKYIKELKMNLALKNRINELIIIGLDEFKKNNDINIFNENILIPYREYTRIELQILLDSKVPKGTWRAGYANTDKDICLFITKDKSHILQENLRYDNSIYSENLIQWISQPKTSHSSSVGQMYINHKKLGYNVHIFARKFAFMNGNKTNPFTYLGKANYYSSIGDKPMKILWKLEKEIPSYLLDEIFRME